MMLSLNYNNITRSIMKYALEIYVLWHLLCSYPVATILVLLAVVAGFLFLGFLFNWLDSVLPAKAKTYLARILPILIVLALIAVIGIALLSILTQPGFHFPK